MRESQIEKYLVERVKALGGEVRKVQWIGRRGAPDRVVMLPAILPLKGFELLGSKPPRTIWVELKAPGEKPKPHQQREHDRLQAMGQLVEVIDSLEGVDDLLA